MERLDKFLTNNTIYTRSEIAGFVKTGRVKVNNQTELNSNIKISESDVVVLDGQVVSNEKFEYYMLNKPQGVISATEDVKEQTVLDLLPKEYKTKDLFPCGRLDKDTVGLLILTNDGETAHKLLSPKNHVQKTYFFKCADPLYEQNKQKIENGITLKDGTQTKPCKIVLQTEKSGNITITEGKYHEIKRLFGAVGNKITFLERISFGDIVLDKSLKRGNFRPLTKQEIITLKK